MIILNLLWFLDDFLRLSFQFFHLLHHQLQFIGNFWHWSNDWSLNFHLSVLITLFLLFLGIDFLICNDHYRLRRVWRFLLIDILIILLWLMPYHNRFFIFPLLYSLLRFLYVFLLKFFLLDFFLFMLLRNTQ